MDNNSYVYLSIVIIYSFILQSVVTCTKYLLLYTTLPISYFVIA